MLRAVNDVVYFAAVMYSPKLEAPPRKIVEELWGAPLFYSDEFPFDHSAFYDREMGAGLKKFFAALPIISQPDRLPYFKLQAIEGEAGYLVGGKRAINIDPGYLAREKVVAASTKNFTHRIYIGHGIYGDLQLMRMKGGSYKAMEWTYADYIRDEAAVFFGKLYERLAVGNRSVSELSK